MNNCSSFYAFYLAKLVILKKQEIKTNQMGMGNKPQKVLVIERVMSVATVLAMCLMFFNVPLAVVSVWAAVMLHLQILQEERHLEKMLGSEYEEYKKRTLRYWGRR